MSFLFLSRNSCVALAAIALSASGAGAQTSNPPATNLPTANPRAPGLPFSTLPSSQYQLVWNDEFNGTQLDESKWSLRQPGARVGGFNTIENTKLDGQGNLVISVKRESLDKITTSMLSTDGKYLARYGYYECRVKLQKKPGDWSAFWLQSPTMSTVGDTRKNGVEIDIYEYAIPMKGQAMSNLHWYGYGKDHKTTGKHYDVAGLNEGYHVFGCEWLPGQYRFYADGQLMWETTEAPSDCLQYIILSAEVPFQNKKHWSGLSSEFQGEDQVSFDYVRVYQTPAQKELNAKDLLKDVNAAAG